MSKETLYRISFFVLMLVGGILRFSGLEIRPLHTDEAVHATKFEALLEEGYYRYDVRDYHGPTLNYFTLPVAWISSRKDFESIDEYTLRSVPAIFGICLIGLLFLFFKPGEKRFIFISGLLLAVSPAFIFYSRYYIHEILLVFFTYLFLFSIFKLAHTRKNAWACISGISVGLMVATKETWIISAGAMLLTALIWIILDKRIPVRRLVPKDLVLNLLVITGVAFLTCIVFFTSFFDHPPGIWDIFRSIPVYLEKTGQSGVHVHPWSYYLRELLFIRGEETGVWSEAGILIFSFIGLATLIKRGVRDLFDRQLLFIAGYSIILLVIYSVIPYKTPWNVLGFYMGFILLAGFGVSRVLSYRVSLPVQIMQILILLAILGHLGMQSNRANFKYFSHPENPYVYAHTGSEIYGAIDTIQNIILELPEGESTHVAVIFPDHDYWPLPWYLRNFRHVGWWDHVELESSPAPFILISTDLEDDLAVKLYEHTPPGERMLYLPVFDKEQVLRPGVHWNAFLRKDLYDQR